MLVGVISYAASALAFSLFAALLSTRWRGHLSQGGLLLFAVVASALWSLAAVYSSFGHSLFVLIVLENLRNLAWLLFMLRLLKPVSPPAFLHWFVPVFIATTFLIDVFPFAITIGETVYSGITLSILGHLIQAILGLSLIEQLFRHTPTNRRWSVKHLYLGLTCVFVYDFYLYADTLLFKQTDLVLWQVRGFVNVIAIPLIAMSTVRSLSRTVLLSVSHTAVFNMAVIFGASVYLMIMAAAGYYVRVFEGTWGAAFQIIFLLLAVLLLVVAVFSHRVRAHARVLLSKHFLHYKYDYRNEWMGLLDALANKGDDTQLRSAAIQAMARIVTAESGMLWLSREPGEYRCVECWNVECPDEVELASDSLATFLSNKIYLINLHEYTSETMQYEGLDLPAWVTAIDNPWLIIPLLERDELTGFIVLGKPMVKREINWEDRDFLIATGRHIAAYLALLETSEALTQARQFEAFNRLSAYVVHDLKNIATQLGLVVSNAKNHKDKPEFMNDALSTVDNAVNKMHRMLVHLRQERVAVEHKEPVDLIELLNRIVIQRSSSRPIPTVHTDLECLPVLADRDRLEAILTHLIENAQEATEDDGYVNMTLRANAHRSILEIIDNGCGMSADFIRNRLFKPFDTTKGNAGMGIGAYEGRELIHSMGGTVKVSSTPGEGTVFAIDVPCIEGSVRTVDKSL